MKSSNKELNYSLQSIENYKKELDTELYKITSKYSDLLLEYFKFIIENIKIKNKNFARFIIIRGLDTITNVFSILLLYTKNIDITYFHCQKSFYFYVEFVGQITEDEKMFLQLTSRDATTYVYKKTIFEINNEFKKLNEQISEKIKDQFTIINTYVSIYRTYIDNIIKSDNFNSNKELLNYFEVLTNKLNNNKISISNLLILEKLISQIYYIIDNKDVFFKINIDIIKKFVKNQDLLKNCEKKMDNPDFQLKINLSNEKFINWLTN
jgi:hypothetical protein